MIRMRIGDGTSMYAQPRRPRGGKPHWPLLGVLCPHWLRDIRVSSRTRRTRDIEEFMWGAAEAGDTVVRSTPQWRLLKRGSDTTMEKPASTWSFDQGTLTVHHLGKTISLGRYATHEFAAKATAVYFAKRQSREKPSALRSTSSAAGMLSEK
jgi:hypothetical protein